MKNSKNDFSDQRVLFPQPGPDPKHDTEAVMRFYKLKGEFPKAVRDEVKRLGGRGPSVDTAEGRLDLRKKFIFTCDPQSARDFDDALSLETDRKGNRTLGVHIADVSHYVRPGSALDREAFRRGTSVYLCDKVVPMLPEELSNGLCSLVPGEDRLTFSVFITYDRSGKVVKRSFAKSVIRSKARFTYEQVMAIISGRGATVPSAKISPKTIARTILALNDLAQQLRAARFANGALDITIPEMSVTLDENGNMNGLMAAPYDESHQLIEECMVAANEAVAQELWMHGVKILARFHDSPDPEKLDMLRAELRGLGVKLGNIENQKVFAQFLQSIKKHPLYSTISMMVLRSMKKAVYDGQNMGHFGLAKRFYAHFTSPIRRYPDLTLHRQLAAYLSSSKGAVASSPSANPRVPATVLARWAKHVNETELTAQEAERGLMEIKKYRVLEDEIASRCLTEYEAVIVKCMPFGVFVELPTLAISGLVHISVLSRSYVRFNESDQSLSAAGESWHIGDRLRVTVGAVDMRGRKIDFVPSTRTRH